MNRLATFRQAFAAAALAMTCFVSAQADAETLPTPAQPALWMLRDADSTIYLFGTIHFMRPETEWRTAAVAAALASSQSLVLEVANPEDQAAIVPLIQHYGRSPERPLSSLQSAEDIHRLDGAASAIGASAAQMDALRPWLAGVVLAAAIPARGGFDPANGVDIVLRDEAVRAGLPITGLETPEEQIRTLSGFPEEGQVAFLRNTLDTVDKAPTELVQLADAWSRGDVEAIADITLQPMKTTTPTVYETVIVQRNHRWADRIVGMLEGSETVFVAVGALHLAGDDSVQNILRVEGVEAVRVE